MEQTTPGCTRLERTVHRLFAAAFTCNTAFSFARVAGAPATGFFQEQVSALQCGMLAGLAVWFILRALESRPRTFIHLQQHLPEPPKP